MTQLQQPNVDFGIITIREDENAAVLKRFPKESIYSGKNRSYVLSRLLLANGESYTVAIIRSIEQGETHGQDVARDLIEDLNPQWLLVVGIAGSVPSDEFTLGDVVVATRLTDYSVRAAIEGRPEEYAVGGGPMHPQIRDRIALLPALGDDLGEWNSKQSIGMDKPQVTVTRSNIYGNPSWQRKVRESLNRHYGVSSHARTPKVTTGAVISSDTLIKDAALMQQWQESARATAAVEMELGGVYVAAHRMTGEYPILAIRGISDIVGFKRHIDWTKYACHSAAAFAHAFLKTRPITPRQPAVKPDVDLPQSLEEDSNDVSLLSPFLFSEFVPGITLMKDDGTKRNKRPRS